MTLHNDQQTREMFRSGIYLVLAMAVFVHSNVTQEVCRPRCVMLVSLSFSLSHSHCFGLLFRLG